MSAQDDGGPAFPQLDCFVDAKGERPVYTSHDGLSLRDYFAAKALQGLCANPGGPIQSNTQRGYGYCNSDAEIVAAEAYALADAMLKARAT